MKINYLAESMRYERASSECSNILLKLAKKRIKDEDNARKNGEPLPDYYDIVIDEIKKLRSKLNSIASDYYHAHDMHTPEFDEDGCQNLITAVVKSWAEDCEDALSNGDAKKMEQLRKEAKNLVDDSVVDRIERKHKEFQKLARDRIVEIIEDTAKVKTNRQLYGDLDGKRMRTRCPLCGGAMYAKQYKHSELYLVKCSRCHLSEAVKP